MAFITFIMSRRQAFESLMEFLETFDASRVLASTQFRFLVGEREINRRRVARGPVWKSSSVLGFADVATETRSRRWCEAPQI